MPTPSQKSSSPVRTTRQHLDELDSLLQRMLDLPVITVEDDVPEKIPAARSKRPTLYVPPVEEEAEVVPGVRSMSVLYAPAAPEGGKAAPADSLTPASDQSAEREILTMPARLPRAPVWFEALLWSNEIFDRCSTRLGAPGRWLQTPVGRACLGTTGVLLLIAALGLLVVDWLPWTG